MTISSIATEQFIADCMVRCLTMVLFVDNGCPQWDLHMWKLRLFSDQLIVLYRRPLIITYRKTFYWLIFFNLLIANQPALFPSKRYVKLIKEFSGYGALIVIWDHLNNLLLLLSWRSSSYNFHSVSERLKKNARNTHKLFSYRNIHFSF